MSVLKVLFVTLLAGTLSISVALFGQHWIDDHPDLTFGSQRDRSRTEVLPDLRLSTPDGRLVSSHNWAGKVVVMHFWASWCTPCLAQIGPLERLQDRYGPGLLQVVSIAIDTPEDVQAFLNARTLNYQVLLGGQPEIALAARFGNRTQDLPFTVLFDHRGRSVFAQPGLLGEDQLRAEVSALLPDTAEQAADSGTTDSGTTVPGAAAAGL